MNHAYRGSPRRERSIEQLLAPLARAQHGLFTREQALAAGATARQIDLRVASGRWERLHPGILRVAGAPETWHQALLGACFAGGRGAAASHRAAAALWRLPTEGRPPVELIVRRSRDTTALTRTGARVHRTGPLERRDVARLDGIPVTTVTRTIIDLAGVVGPHALEESLDDAVRRRMTSVARLRARVEQLAANGRPGIRVLRRLLEQRDPHAAPPGSVLESMVLRDLRASGLPEPVTQFRIVHRRRIVAVVDFAWPEERVAVEADGYRWHAGRARWQRDLARRNAVTGLGWRIIHVTWNDASNGCSNAIAELRRLLAPAAPGPR